MAELKLGSLKGEYFQTIKAPERRISCARGTDALPFPLVAEVPCMTGKYAAAIAFILTLAGAGLAQLRPAFGADRNAQDSQMQMDMPGTTDLGIPSYHAYALKPPF